MPRWTKLNSPGAATSERAALEIELTAAVLRVVRAFLVDVERDAVAALGSPVLVAGAGPFHLGAVMARWSRVVAGVREAIGHALHLPTNDPYLTAVERRMLYSPLPTNAYQSVANVMAISREQNWSKAATARSLAAALNPASGTVIRTLEGLGNEGQPWEVGARRIARTEATGAYSEATLRTLVADPRLTGKRWVAHHDPTTRPSHAKADGQIALLTQPFDVGGAYLAYPGDPDGPLDLTANCRCVMVGDDSLPAQMVTGPLTLRTGDGFDLEPGTLLGETMISAVNPFYAHDPLATINCQKTTAAYELRQRGYDVIASPDFPRGSGLDDWFSGSAKPDLQTYVKLGASGVQRHDALSGELMAAFPSGARGSIQVGWNSGTQHVFNWARQDIGVSFVDAQSGQLYGPDHKAWGQISHTATVQLRRLDNRSFMPSGAIALKSARDTIGPTAAQVAKLSRDALKGKIERLDQMWYDAFAKSENQRLYVDGMSKIDPLRVRIQEQELLSLKKITEGVAQRLEAAQKELEAMEA